MVDISFERYLHIDCYHIYMKTINIENKHKKKDGKV